MSWVAVGTTVVSVAGSAYGASKDASASKKAGALAKQGADAATQAQMDQYYQTREDFAPFRAPANRALATLQSALYGGPVEYNDPTTSPLSADELAKENWRVISLDPSQYQKVPAGADFWKDVRNGEDPMARLARGNNFIGPYNGTQDWYRGADGKLTTTAPQKLTAAWKPQESESFQYTKSRTLEDLGRSLRMMGRGSGTTAANVTGRTLGDLNVANEQNQKNELWNMVKTGQGAAGNIAGAGTNAANNVSANAMASGNTLAQLQMDKGQTQANLWAGLGGVAANAYGAYQMGQYLNKPTAASPTYTPGQGMPLWRNS